MAHPNSGDSQATATAEDQVAPAAPAAVIGSLAITIPLRLLRILSGVPIITLLAFGLLFLVFSTTWKGRSVGLSGAIVAGLSYCSVGYWNRDWFKAVKVRLYAVLLPISLLLFLIPMILAPDGGPPDGRVRHCFVNGDSRFARYSLWNIIPEVDQISVAMHTIPLGDPYVDFTKAARMRSLSTPIYAQLAQDADFKSLGSVMGMGYRELFHLNFRTGHYYVFLPPGLDRERVPCLIYLHGMGGNRKSHFWAISTISTRMKCAVIAPTFGLGNWEKAGSARLVVDVARAAIKTLPIDPKRIYLAGYSNGAKGVTRAVVQAPDLFRGLIYLSPVTEDEFFSMPEFLSNHKNRRILFIHGGQDQRIPREFVTSTVATLRQTIGDVHLKLYDDEDHYVILSQRESVTNEMIEWMQKD